MSVKNSNDAVENRTRDLPVCSAVPQLTAPPRAPIKLPVQWVFGVLSSLAKWPCNEVATDLHLLQKL
jgi:hypothetical protein